MASNKEHYERNAAAGRTVRFTLTMNCHHVSDEDAKATGCPQISIKIAGGTLTPADAKKILDVIYEMEVRASAEVPDAR